MDLTALRYFVTTAEYGSITKAAAHLYVAQPAVSRQIRKLEQDLGVRLLNRTAQGVSLTGQGEHLYRRAGALLQGLSQTRTEVQNWGADPSGPVSVALMPAVGSLVAPPLVARLRDAYPKIQLHLAEGLSAFISDGVLDGRFDLGLFHADQDAAALDSALLLDEPMFLIGPSAGAPPKRKRRHQPLTAAELPKFPLLLPGPPNPLRRAIDRLAAESGLELDIRETVDSTSIIKRLVAAGLGFTVQCYSFVHEEVTRGDLSIRPLAIDGLSRNWTLASLAGRPPVSAVAAVAGLIRDIAAGLADTHHWGPPEP